MAQWLAPFFTYHFFTGDPGDSIALAVTVGVFYASNVEQYLFQQGNAAANFYESLATFPLDSSSTFVRSASNRGWVPMRNPRSRMAQLTARIEPMLAAIRSGRVANYGELILLRP